MLGCQCVAEVGFILAKSRAALCMLYLCKWKVRGVSGVADASLKTENPCSIEGWNKDWGRGRVCASISVLTT